METLEQLRRQIETANDLGGIVRTMKALAAVSIRQYEAAVHSLADYARTVELALHVVLRDLPAPDAGAPGRAARRVGVVVFGSDHGLCGRFNEDVVQHAREGVAERAQGAHWRWLAVGTRAGSLLEQSGQRVDQTLLLPGSAEHITATVRHVLLAIDSWQHRDSVDRVYVFHQHPDTATGRPRPTGTRLLPVSLARFHGLEAKPWPGRSLPTYSMERTSLFSRLLTQHFFVSVFRACAESLAAENASRLAAMQAAEKNLADRQAELTAEFRRLRQDAITNELLDVVAGYEAQRYEPSSAAG
jgi:F-type H+-transporting ATPase subunit gamma